MAIAITMLSYAGSNIEPLTMSPAAFWAEPWRLVSSALPHGGLFHILFNVYWLWIFGTMVEEVFGHVRTLGLIVLFAAGSAAAEYALFSGGIGLSGVGYGLAGMVYILSRRDRRFQNAMDRNTAMLFVGWFFLCIVLTQLDIWRIANVAHGVGGVLGCLAGYALAQPTSYLVPIVSGQRQGDAMKPLGYLGFVALMALSFAGATVLRSSINLNPRGQLFEKEALDALASGDKQTAIDKLNEAIAEEPNEARHWYNLGVVQSRLDLKDEAAKSFRRAALLDPASDTYRAASEHYNLPAKH